jgi:hypothetical protein
MIGPVDHSIITKLIEKLDTGQPKGNALKKLLIRSRLESHFYETYKTYLPIGKLTVEQLDKITGYSEKYIEKQNKAIESSPLPKRAIKNALSGLKFAKMESAFVKNIMLLNLDSDAGNKKWYTP